MEELRETTLTGWVELDKIRSTLATEEVHLQEGRQQLEALIHAIKAVYDGDMAKVEWEHGIC
ncbi:hypothetical protein E2562_007020 [Oryza meyeriana var. granulata]|uniref:Uncharacterized protein n=1 Tax=Oryza meyeriana var. granulata TaxID=110450 RepID=A0A6G1EAM9_9ORYZ|nr:hypothetical protein E2562_007020 [Oryza meyeriana var. granulata]